MEIEFDPAKDATNRRKHGISLRQAVNLEWDTLMSRRDVRHDYGEAREVGHGLIDERLYCVVFVRLVGDVFRIISLRRSNNREKKAYEHEKAKDHPADGR